MMAAVMARTTVGGARGVDLAPGLVVGLAALVAGLAMHAAGDHPAGDRCRVAPDAAIDPIRRGKAAESGGMAAGGPGGMGAGVTS